MSDRLYCTLQDVLSDLDLKGVRDEIQLMGFIRSASQWIEGKLGQFIPEVDTLYFDGDGGRDIWVHPVLEIDAVTDDGVAVSASDYVLYGDGPRKRAWDNGPYTRLTIKVDATGISAWTKEENVVGITGKFGKYLEELNLGISVTLTEAATDLDASNGSVLSAGMVLIIEDEQILVEKTSGTTVAATSLVDGAIAAGDDEITVDDGSEFNAGEVIQIDTEDLYIVKINSNKLYVLRGYSETVIAAHIDDSAVSVYRKFEIKRGVNGTTAAAHDDKAVSQYIPPWDVRYLCKQTAALMYKKAGSGYAGKTGNAELGEVYYHQEFPKSVYKEIMRNYSLGML